MPQAGWCRECGEWVWVDPDGACQNGHGAECVERIHEQSAPGEPAPQPFGVGELPAPLRRFNWGAFFLPLFWGAAYGSWQVLAIWFVALISPIVLGSFVGGSGGLLDTSAIIGVTVASEVVAGLARLWAGANANQLVWKREALRLKFVEGSQPRFTVEHFAKRQRTWTIWSAVVIGVSTALSIPLTMPGWSEYGLTYVGSLMPVAWLMAEAGLGMWLDTRMRTEPAEEPAAN